LTRAIKTFETGERAASGTPGTSALPDSPFDPAVVVDEAETSVRLDEHRGDSDLGDLDLGAEDENTA
jgi:hypothetical protein